MKSLSERRDELAKNYQETHQDISGSGMYVESYFADGFDAALAEVLPQVQRLVEALDIISKSSHGIDCDLIADKVAAISLAEWRKFTEGES